MKALAAALLLVLSLDARGAQTFTLSVHQSQSFQLMGATAAWAVDAAVVDVAVQNGTVQLFGRSAGRTKVVVVSITGENAFDVTVEPKPGSAVTATPRRANDGTAEVRYSSATREVDATAFIRREEKSRTTEIQARTLYQTAPEPLADRARTSIASASYRIFTPRRELTLFDREVDHSPLTLSGTPIRGLHYVDDHWRVHAGVTAYATYQAFLIPLERETVFGAAYSMPAGAHARLTPGVFVYPGKGNVLSLLYTQERGDWLSLRTELGVSGTAGAAGAAAQLLVDTDHDRARLDVRYRPRDFAVVGPGETRGLVADTSWSHFWRRGSTASVAFAATDLVDVKQRVLSASADLDHRLSRHWSLLGGASWGSFGDTESLVVPLGARADFTRGGITAIYRYAQSGTNDGGHGFRLAARASAGRWSMSAFADRQENAPTLDLVFREQPELALALRELGISVTSPADVARALRENAALIELGFIEGVTVDLAPLRTQFGLELAFLGSTATRHQLRARFIRNVVETVATSTDTIIASLTYSRRITAATDVFAGYSYWRTDRRGMDGAIVQPFVEAGVRQRFDGLPAVFAGTGTIGGVVFVDDDLDGQSDGAGVLAEVDVDGSRTLRTNDDGTFEVRGLPRGPHRLAVRVPSRPEAYFTTPSRVEVETGQRVAFGVATTPARLQGRVVDDAGTGIPGVRLLLARGSSQATTTTDSQGAYVIAAAPGAWELSVVVDSVPAGYALSDATSRSVTLERARPLDVSLSLRALRSVSGSGAVPGSEIEVAPLGRKIRADAEGRFSLRSLPPGELTLLAASTAHRVLVPPGPASLSIDLGAASEPPAVRTITRGEHDDTMGGYVLQIGAYRIRANAVQTEERARRAGVAAKMTASGTLWVVRAGPFTARDAAAEAAERLSRAGLETVITAGR
jgi:hypothetical protein